MHDVRLFDAIELRLFDAIKLRGFYARWRVLMHDVRVLMRRGRGAHRGEEGLGVGDW